MNPDDDDVSQQGLRDLSEFVKANSRPWLGYWYWRDKPLAERGAAREVLSGVDFEIANLCSRSDGEDPPDCEALVNGLWSGIEVTELVHERMLKRSLKAIRARKDGKVLSAPEAYFVYERDDLLTALQALIDRKDRPERIQGGPYERYFLVIVTDEFFLDRHTVERLLDGASFQARYITDALLGLSYHPSPDPGGGSCPVFPLTLARR